MNDASKRKTIRQHLLTGLLVLTTCGLAAPPVSAAIPASERQVLLDLYESTNGANWRHSYGWGDEPGTECEWHGVICDDLEEHVAELSLNGNNLQGILPESLKELKNIVIFNAPYNNLTGPIPSLKGLTKLQDFWVSYNDLTGELPSLVDSIELWGFRFAGNRLTGSIPELQGFKSLYNFSIGQNQLTGSIPPLDGITSLVVFYASDNRLEGPIPSLQGLPNLTIFEVDSNQLTGAIPSLEGLTKLDTFHVSGNQLTGQILSLEGLTSLRIFDVSWNNLSGSAPELPGPNKLTSWTEWGDLQSRSALCPNALIPSDNPGWDAATGESPWYQNCAAPGEQVDLNQHGLSGSWAFADAQTQGFLLEVFPDMVGPGTALMFATWFTYDAAGAQRWYTVEGHADRADEGAFLEIYGYRGGSFNSSQPVERVQVGTARLLAGDCTHASLAYDFDDGRSGSIPLTRLLTNANCTPDGDNGAEGRQLLSGAWADVANNTSQGLLLDVDPVQNVFFAAWYTFLPDSAPDAGFEGQHWYTMNAVPASPDFSAIEDIGIYDSTGGQFMVRVVPPPVTDQVGNASITFHGCSEATLDYQFATGPNAGRQGTLHLSYLGQARPGCGL